MYLSFVERPRWLIIKDRLLLLVGHNNEQQRNKFLNQQNNLGFQIVAPSSILKGKAV